MFLPRKLTVVAGALAVSLVATGAFAAVTINNQNQQAAEVRSGAETVLADSIRQMVALSDPDARALADRLTQRAVADRATATRLTELAQVGAAGGPSPAAVSQALAEAARAEAASRIAVAMAEGPRTLGSLARAAAVVSGGAPIDPAPLLAVLAVPTLPNRAANTEVRDVLSGAVQDVLASGQGGSSGSPSGGASTSGSGATFRSSGPSGGTSEEAHVNAFTGQVSQPVIAVVCTAGAPVGVGSLRIRATNNPTVAPHATLGDNPLRSDHLTASWPGGSTKVGFGGYTPTGNVSLPCPSSPAESKTMNITIQAPAGAPSVFPVTLVLVAAAS